MKIATRYMYFVLVGGLIIVALFTYRGRQQPHFKNMPEPRQNPYLMPCQDGGETGSISYFGKVIVNKNFVDLKMSQEENAREAVNKQIKFIESFLTNDGTLTSTTRFFVAADSPTVSIQEIKDTTYGLNLVVDKVTEYTPIPYVERAVAKGSTSANDPALEVTYKAELSVAYCGQSTNTKEVNLLLPYDPYLAFWYVPKDQRRPMRFGAERNIANPCADPEVGHLFVPSFYWYVWEPLAERKDDDGKKYQCEKLIKSNTHYGVYKASVTAPPKGKEFTFGDGLRNIKGPIQGAAIFGPLQPFEIKFDPQAKYEMLTAGGRGVLENVSGYLTAVNEKKITEDPGLMGFFYFLSHLPQIVDVKSNTVRKEGNHLIFHVDGKLRLSLKDISLDAYFGSTDAGAGKAEHWPILFKALEDKDFVFYLGHAGMGLNMNLSQMMASLKLTPQKMVKIAKNKKYQMMAILSCRAYSYFGADLKEYKTKAGEDNRLDLLTMANSNYRPLLYLGLFRYLDRILNNEKPGLYKVLESYISEDDMLVVEGVNRG